MPTRSFSVRWIIVLVSLSLGALMVSCGSDDPSSSDSPEAPRIAAGVDGERIAAADAEPGNWLSYGRDYGEQRFSPLTQIDAGNVGELGLAWHYDTGAIRGHQATPLVVDGVMFLTSTWSKVHALDAATGEELWVYDPRVSKENWARRACCDAVNRGPALWQGKVYVGALDGRLIALNATSGEVVWEVQTTDPERPYTITGAPRVVNGKVVIGNGGAELGVRGYVSAYDAESGEQLWRFYTVPGDPSEPFEHAGLEEAAATWTGEWWKIGGGGTAWDSFSFDPELNLLYVGVGNGSPWTRFHRSPGGGDNLYLCSIVALNADTGELVWYYQTTPGDNWDYTSVQHILLVDLEIDGSARKALVHAPKNGFFYVIDRATGELLSAEPYVPVNWASHVDMETGRPVETPQSNYDDEPSFVYPPPSGGHNWQPMSYSPQTGLVYIPAIEDRLLYVLDKDFEYDPRWYNFSLDWPRATRLLNESEAVPAVGLLRAWDPIAQEEVWSVAHPGVNNSGVLSTAGGLVFQGTADGIFAAYAADTGALLWDVVTNIGMMAPPITFTAGDRQMVAIVAGLGGGALFGDVEVAASRFYDNTGRVFVFELDGSATLPSVGEKDQQIPEPPPLVASAEDVDRGQDLFSEYCAGCHGSNANNNRIIPDLKYSIAETHDMFGDIVLEGALASTGMPAFDDLIGPDELDAIRGYVVARTHAERDLQLRAVEE